jgi:hypothetical protein
MVEDEFFSLVLRVLFTISSRDKEHHIPSGVGFCSPIIYFLEDLPYSILLGTFSSHKDHGGAFLGAPKVAENKIENNRSFRVFGSLLLFGVIHDVEFEVLLI